MNEGGLTEASTEGGAVETRAHTPVEGTPGASEAAAQTPEKGTPGASEAAAPPPQESEAVARGVSVQESETVARGVSVQESEAVAHSERRPEEPPEDWLEPLEEDDFEDEEDETQSWGQSGSREGSVSGSTAGRGRGGRRRRPRLLIEEEWDECPCLGEGWKRKEVFRRSGCYMGKSDTYYMSPTGVRVRSKVELAKCLSNSVDLDMFDFKSGQFLSGQQPRKRRRWAKPSPSQDAGVSDDSSHPADDSRSRTPDSLHRATPSGRPRPAQLLQQPASTLTPLSLPSSPDTPNTDDSDTQDGSTNGAAPSVQITCRKCGESFSTTSATQTLCPKCRVGKAQRDIVFRKWIPCGKCRACQTTVDCGTCASCRSAQQNPAKPVRCRKRKCLCPIRKAPFRHEVALASLAFTGGMFIEEWPSPGSWRRAKRVSQDSDSDEYEPQHDDDEDEEDEEEEDDDGDQIKRKRRTCGRCEGCVVMRDCGSCDFCVDKPKFGGSNKKRQKCRRRQCTRQAMLGAGPGRRGRGLGSSRESWEFEFSDNENEEQSSRTARETMAYKTYSRQNPGRGPEEHTPMSTHQTTHTPVASGRPTSLANQLPQSTSAPRATTHTPLASGRPTSSSNQLPQSASAPRAEAAGVQWHVAAEGRKGVEPAPAIREKRGWSDTALSNQDGVGHLEETSLSYQDGVGGVDEEDGIPMITQIFSLADSGVCLDGELLCLLEALRVSVLPQLWLPILGSGPVLQLLQCSKASAMADTMVHIGPGLGFSITVQEHPLLPTHPLYAQHPARLTTPEQVVVLLRDLERHSVCQGVRSHAPAPPNEPLVNVRLATCHFLVPRSRIRCSKCRYPTEKS